MARESEPKDGDEREQADRSRRFAEVLKARIAASLLPGETEITGDRLDQAADFLLATAQVRGDGQPAIGFRTEAETQVGGRRFMRIAIINKDMPFLVDSIAAAMAARGLPIDVLLHPILPVRRQLTALVDVPEGSGAGEKRESWIYLETERTDAKARRALEEELRTTILDVRAAVADWPQMRERMLGDADLLPDSEGAALLRWLGDGMLTLTGHVTRHRDGSQSDMLGVCRRSTPDLLTDTTYASAFAWFDGELGETGKGAPGRAPLIVKANRMSKVHRRVPLDLFIVPVYAQGRVVALSVHAGMWTSAALVTPPDAVPVLRRQLHTIMERTGVTPGSHDHKSMIHAVTVLPHDLLISFSNDDIVMVVTAVMRLGDRPRPRAALVNTPLGRHIFAFVWLPRDLLSTETRLQIQQMLEEKTGATTLDWSLMVEGGNLALLRYVLDFRGQSGAIDAEAIDRALVHMTRGWLDAVEDALRQTEEDSRAAAIALRYAERFPPYYRTTYGAAEAALDIDRLRQLEARDDLARDARLYCRAEGCEDRLRLKIYQDRGWLPLSDAVPALENFGFRVLSEVPTELAGEESATIHDFTLGLPPGLDAEDVLRRAGAIEEAMRQVLGGRAENDVFNRLVIACELEAHEVDWIRAFYRYLRQANIAFTIYTVVDALAGSPAVTRGLVELFRTQHDPAFTGDRAEAREAAGAAIRAGLAEVAAINDDRVLRLYQDTIGAILRTNAFAPAGTEALAFKFDSALVPGLPKPVPWREIFVYSRRVEGIHLRAGPVARGGLRWSDRRDDFRTEILGLMKAQKVKNAVIVPTGAKGGFYPKQLPSPAVDRDAWFAEGKDSYKLFIRTLLSITDNIVDDQVVHPEGVVIHDGEDPYFVVAADKGTATFSDTANAIALERGFWLGDAFASGGSNGYDHKAMGITARGAWISVQRHFLELGVDVQTEPVRVIGVGDMSGDVFGNGMLLSKAIKLMAAFDHRHIVIDPDPDPATSWAERKRLFALPRSSWADYDPALLSAGGGIFPRSAKRIELSAEARAALGIAAEALDPDALISAILTAQADLLWFGGIGTYVKAADESHAEVGDPANDLLRVDAEDMQVKVIGEGANLGITQAGRIAFALNGGRINTDFIDNSAGVDCSDNEVNIKIALAAARRAGDLSEDRRNALLGEMTEDVAELVLEDNRLQALALSIAEQGGPNAIGAQARLIETLEDTAGLDRATEGLGDAQEMTRRAADGLGLTRPELAVLLSNAKLVIQEAVEAGPLPQDEQAAALILEDFPSALREHYRPYLIGHRLRCEIVGTAVANRMVNRMGLIHPFELAEEVGLGLEVIGSAFIAASALLGLERTWEKLEREPMPETARVHLFENAALALRAHMADLVRSCTAPISPASLRRELQPGVDALREEVDQLLGIENRQHVEGIAGSLEQAGAAPDLAAEVARLFALDGAIGLARLAAVTGIPAVALARAFIDLGAALGIDWAQAQASIMTPADPWERLLVAGLARDFQQMRFALLRRLAAQQGPERHDPVAEVGRWAEANQGAIAQFRRVIRRAQAASPTAPAMLAQIAGHARALLQG